MKKYTIYLIVGLLLIINSCRTQNKTMSTKTSFSYSISVTAPHEYPVEVHLGYLADGKDYITSIPKAGMENQGWGSDGKDAGMGASHIPSFLELTWVSYAEKKFWKVDAELPAAKILECFRKGFQKVNRGGDTAVPFVWDTYNQLVIGVAPGGVVVVWLQAATFRVEIGRYQAKDTIVSPDAFYRNPDEENQQQFFESWFKIAVPPEAQETIKKTGITYGLWDEYRKKYNWRYRTQFYNDDKDVEQYYTYYNGESMALFADDIKKREYLLQAIPCNININFTQKWAEAYFDDKELMAAFKELAATNPNEPIDLVGKVGFMYNDMTFWVEANGKKISLNNVKVKLWSNN